MAGANQYFISNVLGSTVAPVRRQRMGVFGALRTVADMVKAKHSPLPNASAPLPAGADRIIAQAFEETRNGFSPDRLLADPVEAAIFNRRCRDLGLAALPEVVVNQRLLKFRKSPPAGIRLSRTSKRERPRSHHAYLHASEWASKRMSYRYGATVDDILADPQIGSEFDALAALIAPGRTPLEYRLGALYVRKVARVVKEVDLPLFKNLNVARFSKKLVTVGSMADVNSDQLPSKEGVYVLREQGGTGRDLYVAWNENVRLGIQPFRRAELFEAVANHLWIPRLDQIFLQFFEGSEFEGVSSHVWELKLIQARAPVFNLPIRAAA